MIDAAMRGLQHHGLAGMSFTEVLAGSGAARGAIYHHFPGGKRQLVEEAAERQGRQVLAHLTALAERPARSPRDVVEAFVDLARPVVAAASEGGGCAVAAVTTRLDADSADLCRVAATAFGSWVDQLAGALATAGMPTAAAADLAALLVTMLEGAQVLCRASGDLEHFERAARAALAVVAGTHEAV
jgi:AcrR family transcriptional regulator